MIGSILLEKRFRGQSCASTLDSPPDSPPKPGSMALQSARVLLLACVAIAARQLPAQTPAPSFSDLQERAEQARKANQTEEEVTLYRKAVTLRPSWGEGWWYLGTALYDLHRYTEALRAFQRLSQIDSTDGSAPALTGLCEFQLGRYPDSLRHLFRAEELGMGENQEMVLVVRYHVALLLNRSGQFEWARDRLRAFAWTGDVTPPIIEAVGINTLRLALLPADLPAEKRDLVMKAGQATWEPFFAGHPEQADRTFAELIAGYPREPNLHYAYGVHLLDSDPEGALREFQQELRINPSQVVARVQIVFLDLKRGEPENALPLARDAAKLGPSYFLAHNALGRVLLALGQTAAAIEELRTAVRLEPQSPENHFDLAEAYRKADRGADAARERAEFERIKKQRDRIEGPTNTSR